MTQARAVVVGAGLAGLSAAVVLAKQGYAVTVLEQYAAAGGLVQRFRRGANWFDTGFHFMTGSNPGGIMRRLTHFLGIRQDVQFQAPDLSQQWSYHFKDTHCGLPAGYEAIREHLRQLDPGQASACDRFLDQVQGVVASTPVLRLHNADFVPMDIARDTTVSQALDHCGVQGLPRQLLGGASSIIGMLPEDCTMDMYAGFAGTGMAGCWRVANGGGGIVQALINRLQALGGTIEYRRSVEGLVTDEGQRLRAVVDQRGQHYPADLVIYTAPPRELQRIACTTEPVFRTRVRERLGGIEPSTGAVFLHARLRHALPAYGARHHFLCLDDYHYGYAVSPDAFAGDGPPQLEALLYVPCHEVAHWQDSRPGQRPAAYLEWKQYWADQIYQVLETIAPGTRAAVHKQWLGSPLTVRDFTRNYQGGCFGLSHGLDGLHSQPLTPKTRFKNLWLAGQNIHHPGILGAMISGCITTSYVCGIPLEDALAECAAD